MVCNVCIGLNIPVANTFSTGALIRKQNSSGFARGKHAKAEIYFQQSVDRDMARSWKRAIGPVAQEARLNRRRQAGCGGGTCLTCSGMVDSCRPDRKSTRLNSSHSQISYAVFCLKKKNS